MTAPLGPPLPTVTRVAALQQQLLLAEALPEWRVEPVSRWFGRGQTGSEIGTHSVASLPKMHELTGVTIGPAHTIETSGSGTWFVDCPRS